MVIYLDILIILNMFVDYFLLLSCSILLNISLKKIRLILGALVGSLFSLLIILPSMNFFINFFIKIITGVMLILITFGYKEKPLFIKTLLIFLTENLIFVGSMFLIWVFMAPRGMFWKNGVTYIAVSPLVIVIGSLVAYIFTSVFNFIMSKRVDGSKIYKIDIVFNNKTVSLKAFHDTGNCLVEPFSGKPVCVCEYNKILSIFPKELVKFFVDFFNNAKDIEKSEFKKYIKLIPGNTVFGSSILPAFLPENFYIFKGEFIKQNFDCYVAVTTEKISDGEYSAIIGDFN